MRMLSHAVSAPCTSRNALPVVPVVVSDSLARQARTGQARLRRRFSRNTISSHSARGGSDGRRFIQEFAISDRGTANYDAVNKRRTNSRAASEGLLIHFAGFDDEDGVFRIVNVWERREHGRTYFDEHVMPAVRRAR